MFFMTIHEIREEKLAISVFISAAVGGLPAHVDPIPTVGTVKFLRISSSSGSFGNHSKAVDNATYPVVPSESV